MLDSTFRSLHFTCFFFSSRRRHTIFDCDWSSDVCSSDLKGLTTNSAAADKHRVRTELRSLKRSLLSDSSEFHRTHKSYEIQANEVCRCGFQSDHTCSRRFQ